MNIALSCKGGNPDALLFSSSPEGFPGSLGTVLWLSYSSSQPLPPPPHTHTREGSGIDLRWLLSPAYEELTLRCAGGQRKGWCHGRWTRHWEPCRGGVEPWGRVCQGKGKAVPAWTLWVVRKVEAAWEGGWGWQATKTRPSEVSFPSPCNLSLCPQA